MHINTYHTQTIVNCTWSSNSVSHVGNGGDNNAFDGSSSSNFHGGGATWIRFSYEGATSGVPTTSIVTTQVRACGYVFFFVIRSSMLRSVYTYTRNMRITYLDWLVGHNIVHVLCCSCMYLFFCVHGHHTAWRGPRRLPCRATDVRADASVTSAGPTGRGSVRLVRSIASFH